MKRVRYVNGTNYYEITLISVDFIMKSIQCKYRTVQLATSTGFYEVTESVGFITDELNMRYDLVIDPAWDAQSIPAKPEGFAFDDPGTWGSLNWEDIPKISVPLYKRFTDFLVNSVSSDDLSEPVNVLLERYLLQSFIDTEELPPETDGWSLVDVEM